AFLANGAEVPVVGEKVRNAARPAIFLGDTRFAREHGIDPATFRDWSYVQRSVGRDLILVGHDHPGRGETTNARRPNWDRVGTAKAAVDFAREYLGVRFLYPDVPAYNPVAAAAKIDLLASPAIEFLPLQTVTVPGDLDVRKTPLLRLNTAHPAGGGFYDLAHNRFPRVDEVFGGHTWERAVPPEIYWDKHPEFFALISGTRLKPDGGNAQYCLSNPEVRELIYRDLASWLDRGYTAVDLGQPDGFRECQCEECFKLYGTGQDWSEKIWIFNREVAERLEKSHPGKDVTMMSYILTAKPPRTFAKFPSNTCVMLTGTNEEDMAPWRDIEVPRGFTGYLYNWCPNLGTRYTPMRTPGFVETQVKRLAANRIQSLYRDGPGQLFGLEGPVYYVMGRMFDDPDKNAAKELLPEFCEAAFGNKSAAFYMRSFYDQLYHAIALYSDHIGTRCDVWTYQPLPGEGRPRKTVQDPFQLIAFLYPPNLLASLDADLSLAERQATGAKARTRLALVRREFEYLRHFAKVVHLYQAWQMVPDEASRNRLLDAIDARNGFIHTLYDQPPNRVGSGDWAYVLFPFPGHDANHLRLAHDGYQEPYANTCFNWDTEAMRKAPAPGKKRLTVARAKGPVTLDSPEWSEAESQDLTLLPPLRALPRSTSVRLLRDGENLYFLAECKLESDHPAEFPVHPRDRALSGEEALDLYLAPQPGREIFYRFAVGANAASRYDAVAGLIADAMDPRHGKDDSTWNGEWRAETKIDAKSHRWQAQVTIPFATLGAEPPPSGMVWRANFARYHRLPRGQVDQSLWSTSLQNANMD
ncbi:MAG: DUF4838 domain-containing protein, partial [Verrucomicrobiae bacterium]|nr:DUF4838 domain-containing protein [Verrucomicrobiae bacterium]